MFTLQILHASDLEGGVDAIGNAPNFASIVSVLEAQAEADGLSSVLISAGDNYIPGPFFNAAGDAATFRPLFEGFYNEFFGLIDSQLITPLADANGDGYFDNDEIEAFLGDATLNTNGYTFEDIYTTDINGDGEPDYFEEIDNFEGRVDVSIMNILDFDASAVGNHEFDAGTDAFENIINYDSEEGNDLSDGRFGNVNYLQEVDWPGIQFPYLSANLDFSEDTDVGPLFATEILPAEDFETDLLLARVNPDDPSETGSDSNHLRGGPATILTVDGEQIGVVGATTQLIASISSTGNIDDISSPGMNDMPALAAVLQPFVDELTAQGVDKIILTSHLQQFALEEELASLMSGVDVILAGGSDTISADDDDLLRPGDEADQPYPLIVDDLDGNPTAVVSTNGEYTYVGRLVVDFDENGVIVPESIDPAVSGAFGTDDDNTVTVLEGFFGTVSGVSDLSLEEAQEVPPLDDGDATGSFAYTYYDDINFLLVEGIFDDLSSTLLDVNTDPTAVDGDGIPIDAIHLHNAAAGENGPVIRSGVLVDPVDAGFTGVEGEFDFGFFIASTLTDEEEAELLAGNLYVNIHTEDNPGGELRGQLFVEDLAPVDTLPSDGQNIGAMGGFDVGPAGEVVSLVDAVSDVVNELDGTIFGETEVFIEGRRAEVRTEETTLGNLTADANLVAAQAIDPEVIISLKNGGGIRAAIGETDADGNLLPPQENPVSGKQEGEISRLDIQNSLRFNNGLVIVDLSTDDLKVVLEHAVASSEPGATPGQFFQLGGLRVSVDPSGTPQELNDDGTVSVAGTRIETVALTDEAGNTTQVIIENGAPVEGAPESIKAVTLDFLAGDEGDLVGGDGYPFRALSPTVVDTGIGEQTALEEFLEANFPPGEGTPFDTVETDPAVDSRIQLLDQRSDTVAGPAGRDEIAAELVQVLQGESDPDDEDSPEGASEVVSHDNGFLYVTNGNLDRIDVFSLLDPEFGSASIDLTTLEGYDGVQSVAAQDGVIVAVVDVAPSEEGVPNNGFAAIYDAATLELITTVETGNLPDSVTFTPDGTRALVANEGEFNSESDLTVDAAGGVTVIELADLENVTATTIDFSGATNLIASAASQGLRLHPDFDPVTDLEPEFIAVTPDNGTAFVSLQENNAFAVLDLETLEFTDIISQGVLDHFNGLPELTTVEFPDLPLLGTDANGLEIDLGGFSGLWFDGVDEETGDLNFLIVPDRGPNGSEVVDGARTFNLPDYQARIIEVSVDTETNVATIENEILLTDGAGAPITGLPNIEGFDEIPVDAAGEALPYDPLGADMEGIVRASDGTFWTVDEYRPAIYHFNESGSLIDRFVPEGASQLGDEIQPEGTFGEETLPAEYNNRRTNRGFEAVALNEEDGVLYAFIQTPLANPDRDASDTSQVIRILGIDVTDGTPVEEYVMFLEDPSADIRAGGRVDKIGDAVYVGDGKIVMLERDANFGSVADKNVFEIDLTQATNLIETPLAINGTIEQQTAEQLVDAGLVAAEKRKLFGLPEIGYTPSDKPEGLALIEPGTYAVLNDNDFGIEDSTGLVPQLGIIEPGSNAGFDATDDEVIDIVPRNTLGLRQADAIAVQEINGVNYVFSANEGDGRGDAFDGDGNPIPFGDEARVSELAELGLLDPDTFITSIVAEDLPIEEAQEVADPPVVDTDATGSFTATADEVAMTVTVSGTFSSLSSALFNVGGEDAFGNPESSVHVHLGDAGTNGPIFFNLTVTDNGDGSGSFEGTAPVTEDELATFRADGYYVNLHTETNQAGELRGQIDLPDVTTVGDQGLYRLGVSTIDGDTDGDGDIDVLHSFGSRSFTIFDTAGNVVFDSGNEFETIIANLAPERFNDDDGELGQNRSDAKGPEPEAVAVGQIGLQTYAFIGLERDSGVMIYNVTNPEDSRFVTYLDGFETGNIGPETIAFISEEESSTGNAQIAVAYEISGTTAVYDLGRLDSDVTTESFYQIALGRTVDIPGYDFWSELNEIASDDLIAQAFEDSNEWNALIEGLTEAETIDLVFTNATGMAATEEEQAEASAIVAEDGFAGLFVEFLDGEFDPMAVA